MSSFTNGSSKTLITCGGSGLILMDETEPVGPRKSSQSLGVKMMKIKNPGSANLMGAATILCFLTLCESASAQTPCERTD